jgi:hypothetical protein
VFDSATTDLIQHASPLEGLDLDRLPQFLTEAYAKVVAARLGAVKLVAGQQDPEWASNVLELRRLAETYEGLAIFLSEEDPHRSACAFVAGSAHHTLDQARRIADRVNGQDSAAPSLSAHGIGPELAACLLFLIGGQQADAAETVKTFKVPDNDEAAAQLLEGISALASGEGRRLMQIARMELPPGPDEGVDYLQAAVSVLWRRLARGVQLLARAVLGLEVQPSALAQIDGVLGSIESTHRQMLYGDTRAAVRLAVAGPYHLARLLKEVARLLIATAVVRLPPPGGLRDDDWGGFTRHFARERPFLWRNHISAIEQGFLEPGRSSVLTFPTGAGKTTLTELRIVAEVLRGRKVVYLAPTRALVDQVTKDVTATLRPIAQDVVRGRFLEDFGEQAGGRVYVQTPEQCLAYLSFDPDAHTDIGLIVVDECHQLSGELPGPHGEERLPGRRSIDAMWTLLALLERSAEADVVLISAMVRNSGALAAWLQVATGRPAFVLDLAWKPTRQVRGVVVYEANDIDQLEAALHARREDSGGRAPRATDKRGMHAQPVGLFCHTQVWATNSSFVKFPILAEGAPLAVNPYWGLTANRNEVGGLLLGAMAVAGMRPIVFSQQIGWTSIIAEGGAAKIEAAGWPAVKLTDSEEALFRAAAVELGDAEHVERPPRGRVGVHHGLLLPPERLAMESAFRRADGLRALVATPTVAQGINLPAEAVIIAGDDRWTGDMDEGGMQPLAVHELLNAAGRAGRAGHYAHGIVVDLPGKVLTVQQSKRGYAVTHLDHIMGLFGLPDQCLDIIDPLTQIIDRIQRAGVDCEVGEYIVRRAAGIPHDVLARVLGASLGNSHKDRREEAALEQVAILKAAAAKLEQDEKADEKLNLDEWRELASLAATSTTAVATVAARMAPEEVVRTWTEQDFAQHAINELVDVPGLLFALVDPGNSDLSRIIPRSRARQREGNYEFTETMEAWEGRWRQALREVIPMWRSGAPIASIGAALHRHRDADGRVKAVQLGRRFSLQSASALAFGVSIIARVFEKTRGGCMPEDLAIRLHLIPGCIREGFDDPDKLLLFWIYRRDPGLFPRVRVHQAFDALGAIPPWGPGVSVDERRVQLRDLVG